MKKLFGFLGLLLGLLGFLACVGAMGGLWIVRTPATQTALDVLGELDQALQTGGERLGEARAAVQTIHEAVEPAAKHVARLAEAATDPTPEEEKEIERLRAEVLRKLDQLEGFVKLSRTAVDMLGGATRSARKLPVVGARADRVVEQASDSSNTLAEVSEFLKSLSTTLARLRTDKKARQALAQKAGTIARDIEMRLQRLEERLQSAANEIAAVRTDVVEVRQNLPAWSLWAALGASIVFAWLTLGQWALLCTGMRWMRTPKPEPAS